MDKSGEPKCCRLESESFRICLASTLSLSVNKHIIVKCTNICDMTHGSRNSGATADIHC
jgi:hypothetical protein